MSESEFTDNSSKSSFCIKKNNKQQFNLKEKNYSKNLKIIADLLTDICKADKSNQEKNLILIKPFLMKKIPAINIYDFIERLSKYSKASEEVFILVLIYIDRICGIHKININYFNIHKFILASFIISIKYLEDNFSLVASKLAAGPPLHGAIIPSYSLKNSFILSTIILLTRPAFKNNFS